MCAFMETAGVDFVKLFGFFLFDERHKAFAFWDLAIDFPVHYELHPDGPIRPLFPYKGGHDARWGYGFSYVYK